MNANRDFCHAGRTLGSGGPCLIAAAIATLGLGMADAGARGGGGFGGGGSFGGGAGGGHMAQSSVAGANRSFSGGADAAGGLDRSGAGSTGANRTNRDIANRDAANRDRRNPNIGAGNDINVGIDPGFGNNAGRIEHPIAAGVVIGRIGVTTGGVAGTYYYSLPSAGCRDVVENGANYILCTEVYYQEVWSGNDVVYEVVNP